MKNKFMKYPEETIFVRTEPTMVIKHLESVKRRIIKTSPSSLCLKTGTGNDSEFLYLHRNNGIHESYPVRRSFLHKLLKWYNLPTRLISRLSSETIVSAANDFLLNMNSSNVFIKLENDEALTITSLKYTDIPDLELLKICSISGISEVSRDDFCMRIYSEQEFETEPIPGDKCGFGYNLFNSETGFMGLKILHYILRYICSNGAIASFKGDDTKSLYHYNLDKDYAYQYIQNSLKKISETREQLIEKLRSLKVSYTSEKVLKLVLRRLSGVIGSAQAQSLMKSYKMNTASNLEEFDSTKYALFNFITSSAKTYDIHKRAQLEQVAGDLFLF